MSRWYRTFPGHPTLSQRQVLAVTIAATVAPAAVHVIQAPSVGVHEQNRARHSHVITNGYAQRGAASLALEALVTPPQTQHVVTASPRSARQARHVLIVAPRPLALTNHAILQAGSPRTVTTVVAHSPLRQRHLSEVLEPRPAALTNHAILAAGQARTVNVLQTWTPSRRPRPAVVLAPRPSGLIFTPAAAAATPPRTVTTILAAQPQRQKHTGRVVAPRPAGLIFTPAAAATPPRTVTVIVARSAPRQVVHPRIVTARIIAAPVTAPRPVVIDQAWVPARRRPFTRIITRRVITQPVAAVIPPPRPLVVQASPPRRGRLGHVLGPARQVLAATAPVTTPASTAAMYGYVTGTPGSGVVTPTGGAGLIIVGATADPGQTGATGLPISGYAPIDVCALGYSNQVLGGVVVGDVETLIGRQFHGLRQNQAYTTTGIATAITEYDAGRTTSYRSIQFDTAPGGWAAVATGLADTQLTTFCTNVTNANRWTPQNPFLVCLHHEATLSPFGTAGFSATDYKAMWAHCVPLMLATGAPIAFAYIGWDRMFVGANGVGPPTAGQGIDDLDPGSSLYTYIGSDVYNSIDSPGVLRYGIYAATLLGPVRAAAVARGKDWMIGEMGCEDGTTSADHTNKAYWLDGLRVYLDGCGTTSPGVCRALLTTIKADASNYNVDSSAESLAAWQRLGGDVYYS